MSEKESEQQIGVLNKIIFQNDSGFIIGSFTDQYKDNFTSLGNIINPQIKLEYKMMGNWTEEKKYGEQFKFVSYETNLPTDATGIFKYIVRICHFVGSAKGNALVDKYGDQTLEVMKTDPERIAEDISGITLERAKTIQATLLENEINEKLMVELETLLDVPGMRKSLPGDLIKNYQSNAAEILKQNPYILTSFHGVGFPLADRVALNIGYARDSIHRKEAATLHCIQQNMQEGSTWIDVELLIVKIQELIQVPELSNGIYSLIEKQILCIDSDHVALAGVAADEAYIAEVFSKMEAAV